MFPEMATELIESVLRANKGAVDETIDQLLTMNTVNPEKKSADTDALIPVNNTLTTRAISIPSRSLTVTNLVSIPILVISNLLLVLVVGIDIAQWLELSFQRVRLQSLAVGMLIAAMQCKYSLRWPCQLRP